MVRKPKRPVVYQANMETLTVTARYSEEPEDFEAGVCTSPASARRRLALHVDRMAREENHAIDLRVIEFDEWVREQRRAVRDRREARIEALRLLPTPALEEG